MIRRTSYAFALVVVGLCLLAPSAVLSQGATKWISVGTLSNWYSEVGCEIEHGNFPSQQYGLRWPAQYNYQDNQAAKGLWIGAQSWTDDRGVSWPVKVVHVGPRVDGTSEGEFFTQDFRLVPKAARPLVIVDGDLSFSDLEEAEDPDPTLPADRVLITRVNTALGISMERKVYVFSQQYHDNYHILDFTFTNTGNIDGDADIELPAQTVNGLYFYWQFRYSINRSVRYIVNNSAGWGINTMNDARGYPPDIANSLIPPSENDVKAQFAWHGYHNQANKPAGGPGDFNNIGTPVFDPSISVGFIPLSDTTWRLAGHQHVGIAHLHADVSASNSTGDPNAPSTSNYVASDEGITRNNSQFDAGKMASEYARMSQGHAPRHAWLVVPDGNFKQQSGMANIGEGSPGGWSLATGYGPYSLQPGESIRIVYAEGASGLTREEELRIGRLYKNGTINTTAKSDSVLTIGKARILDTYRRAVANFNSGYNLPEAPFPPASFTVQSGGNKIDLSWAASDRESENNFVGYRLYRAQSQVDSNYHLIYQCGGTPPTDPQVDYDAGVNYSFEDTTAIRGRDYYYYVSAISSPIAADPATLTPAGVLESSRFYTQTYHPANLKRPPGSGPDKVRVVPNPFYADGTQDRGYFSDRADKIAFFDIPGKCTIRIYTELGELVKQIEHTNGTGDDYWYSVTSSNQVVVSGVYIVHITPNEDQTDPASGAVQFTAGKSIIKKLIIIR